MRVFKKILVIIFGFFLLLISVGVGLAFYFEDHVKQIVVDELNKRLNQDKAKLEVDDIDLSLIKKFPLATIDFVNATLKVSNNFNRTKPVLKDTLLSFGHIYLEFNVQDLFNKKYAIKTIEFNNGMVNWMVDENGNSHNDIFNTSTDSSSKDFRFALNKFILKECKLQYNNLAKKQDAQFVVQKIFLKGDFSNEDFDATTSLTAHIDSYIDQEVSYIKNRNVDVELRLVKNNNQYEIHEGKLSVEEQQLNIAGSINRKVARKTNDVVYGLNIKISANEFGIESLLDQLPERYKEKLNDYKSKGTLSVVAMLIGSYSNTESPEITAGFEIKDGEFTYVPNAITMNKINIKGSYTNGKLKTPQSNCVEITEFSSQLGNGDISGKCIFKNFTNPIASLTFNGNFSLADWQRFVPIDSIETLSGNASIAVQMTAQFRDSLKLSALDMNSFRASGNINVDGFNLHIKNKKLQFDDCKLALALSEKELLIDNLQGKVLSSDIKMSGLVQNLLPHMINHEKYSIAGIVQSDYINLNELLITNGGYVLRLPDSISVALQVKVNKVDFRKFTATQVSGQFALDNRKLTVNDLSLQAFDGTIQAYGSIETKEDNQLLVTCDAGTSQINIQSLFYQCEDFNQTHIQSKNINGVASATIHLAMMLHDNLKVEPDKIYSSIDLTIERGELINYETLKSLSKFISMDELLDVKFSTLHNTIEIKNKAIYIPEMELKSSAMDLSLSGVQTFDNEIEYHFRILLSEILSEKFKKKRKKKKENEEYFGEIEDDGSGKASLYLTMTKTVDDPKMSFDKKVVLKKAQKDLKAEGKNLKTIIKEETGWRGGDTINAVKKSNSSGLLFDWDGKDNENNTETEMQEDTLSHLSKTQLKRKQALENFKKNVFKK